MTFDILTLFPEMFVGPFDESIVKRSKAKQIVNINLVNIRDFAVDKHGMVDDRPYGGGVGMVMRVEPIFNALEALSNPVILASEARPESLGNKTLRDPGHLPVGKAGARMTKVILMDPRGEKLTQTKVREYSKLDELVIICGHYEGVDQRVSDYLIDESISVGDYVLTGGEIPAMIIVDAVTRLIPGVLEKPEATLIESFSQLQETTSREAGSQFEYPQYTRPEEFNGWKVPEILLSGNHKEIEKWRGNNSH